MAVRFRNVELSGNEPVASWPYEAIVTAIDRGLLADWRPLFAEIREQPWGQVTRRVQRYLSYREPDGAGALFRLVIERARSDAEAADRAEVASRVRAAVQRSGLSAADFAEQVGTSASRLSTYVTATVMPSAAMLMRIERGGRSSLRPSGSPIHEAAPSMM